MRKRSEAVPGQGTLDEPKAIPAKEGHRYPMETDFSEMSIALAKKGYATGVHVVGHWEPQVRHVVAMWLEGDLAESDIPEAVKAYKKRDGETITISTPETRKRTQVPHTVESRVDEMMDRTVAKVIEKHGPALAKADKHFKETTATAVARASAESKMEKPIFGELLPLQSPPETFTITSGEEKYFPVNGSYNSFAIPVMTHTFNFNPGEDKVARVRAESVVLDSLKSEMREVARVSYLRSLKGIKADAKE